MADLRLEEQFSYVNSKRTRKMTDRGRAHQLESLTHRLNKRLIAANKRANVIRDLRARGASDQDITLEFKNWVDVYEQCLKIHEEYNSLLPSDSEKQRDVIDFCKYVADMTSFKKDMVSWFRLRDYSRLNLKENDGISPRDSVSQVGSRSGSGSTRSKFSSLSMARAKEETHLAGLKAQAEALKQKQVIEQAKLKLAMQEAILKMQEEELQVQTQLAVSGARARALEEFESGSDKSSSSTGKTTCRRSSTQMPQEPVAVVSKPEVVQSKSEGKSALPKVAVNTIHDLEFWSTDYQAPNGGGGMLQSEETVYMESQWSQPVPAMPVSVKEASSPIPTPRTCYRKTELDPKVDEFRPQSQGPTAMPVVAEKMISVPRPSSPRQTRDQPPQSEEMDTPAHPVQLDETHASANPAQSEETHTSANLAQSGEAWRTVVQEMKRPKSEIKEFSGDPLQYRRFIRQFQSRIVAYTTSNEERLNYLEQFTVDEPNRIVTGFSCLDADLGYPAAMKELEERYGDAEVIASAYIRRALDWPLIKADDPRALDAFSIFLAECENAVKSIDALKILEYPDNLTRLVKKLPYYMHDKWRTIVHSKKEKGNQVDFATLTKFVKTEAKKSTDPVYGKAALMREETGNKSRQKDDKPAGKKSFRPKGAFATVEENKKGQEKDSSKPSKYSSKPNELSSKNETQKPAAPATDVVPVKPCLYCDSSQHTLDRCDKFAEQSRDVKMKTLRDRGACFGCFKPGHRSKDCKRRLACRKCEKKHPTALHIDEAEVKTFPTSACNMGETARECTLAIVPVVVRSKKSGISMETYAFLDPGSSISFISEELAGRLQITGKSAKLTLDTMGLQHRYSTTVLKDCLEVCDLSQGNAVDLPQVYTKDKMPVGKWHIPTQEDISKWPHLKDLTLPVINSEVGLLIGNAVADAYSPIKVITGPRGTPHATRTMLGWVVWNVVRRGIDSEGPHPVNQAELVALERFEEDQRLEQLVRASIDMDFPEKGIELRKQPSIEDKMFLEKVNDSIALIDGHYQIGLPFRVEEPMLPDNRGQALKRLHSLKSKLLGNDQFRHDYVEFMEKIINKGYAEPVPEDALGRSDGHVWFIPHHGIYHPRKPTKIRVVFDCSAKQDGISLNDVLLQGPNLTNDLLGVLLRFRQQPVAILGDIEKMFYQVNVPEAERDFLRFLWWPSGDLSSQPREYRMAVHLFGAASSPACCNMALRRTVHDHLEDKEDADHLINSFYVDDYLDSVVNTTSVAIERKDTVKTVCRKGGFNLTGWSSNKTEIIDSIPIEERSKELQKSFECDSEIPAERALGVMWDPAQDTLGFQITLPTKPPTRRGILSLVSTVYDPIGLAAPYVLPARMLLQKLTKQGNSWDDPISEADLCQWNKWLSNIPLLETVGIPRSMTPPEFTDVNYQLHVFADASEKGYGVAAYVRVEEKQGPGIYSSLLYGKSRVAPLKKVTIPRMELTAATIAVKSGNMISKELEYQFKQIAYWTDSMSVLRYVNNTASRFHTFVANRLTVIHEGSVPAQWHYVNTKDNPADLVSRGLTPRDREDTAFWLSGPDFLAQTEAHWPQSKIPDSVSDEDPEVRKTVNTAVEDVPSCITQLLGRVSTWSKVKRVLARVLKWKPGTGDTGRNTDISVKELAAAETCLIKHEQQRFFQSEIETLQSADPTLKRSSTIRKLDPYLEDGVLHVGGRIGRTPDLPKDSRHQILIPKESPVARRIVEEIHGEVGHLGRNVVLARLREKYWIPAAISLIRQILVRCVICRRYQARALEQKMAELPIDRVTGNEPPFSRAGMDYFGPFEIKIGRSLHKRYGVVFTCCAIRAIHIEVSHSLDTSSCIQAIRRFISRRGSPKKMHSDNGTNLVGAEKELREAIENWNKSEIADWLHQRSIVWEFNPPSASHFGGIWERQIRTIRKILYSLLHEQTVKLDDEGLRTLFCETEYIVNSRPLTQASDDPQDLTPLTPNALLTLRLETPLSPGVFQDRDNYSKKRWRRIQFLADNFWRRWHAEYLHTLQERSKWIRPSRNVEPGDIVLVVDNSAPRNSWNMARVESVTKDSNGLVRVATVKSKFATYSRPIAKLVLLLEADPKG